MILDKSLYATVDPDTLQENPDPRAIIYTGKLYVDDQTRRTHRAFYNRSDQPEMAELRAQFEPLMADIQTKTGQNGWFRLYDRFLFGRIGNYHGRSVVSFWGCGADEKTCEPIKLIPSCVRELLRLKLIHNQTVVVYGNGQVAYAQTVVSGGDTGKSDPEAAKRIELMKRMHLATGAEKQAIMKKLGVGKSSAQPAGWTGFLQQKQLLAPGHQFWRMSSESCDRALECALDKLADDITT
jgi:hypothetical protein